MKILIILPGFFPVTDGQGGAIEKLVEIFLKYNEKLDNEVVVYSPKISENVYDKINIKNVSFRIIDKTKISFKIKRIIYGVLNKITKKYIPNAYIREVVKDIKKNLDIDSFDKVIFENGVDYIPFFDKCFKRNFKLVLHLHNDYLSIDTKNGKEIFDLCDNIWTVSSFIKNRVLEIDNSINSNKVKVLYNAIDLNNFKLKLSVEEILSLKQELGINNELVFIFVGRLMELKGIYELILAFNKISKIHKNVKLLIVGGSKDLKNKDSFISKVSNVAKDNDNIIFVGHVHYRELYKYYQLADCQIVPSKWNEAFGLILLEGMSCNLPIIASKIGGIPEVLGSNVKYINPNDIVNSSFILMDDFIKEPTKYKEMINNYNIILNKFSSENFCEKFNEYIKE